MNKLYQNDIGVAMASSVSMTPRMAVPICPSTNVDINGGIVIALQSFLWYAAINDSNLGGDNGYQSCGSKC